MIRRPPRSTLDRSSAASDVYKRQILVYAQELLPGRVGLAAGMFYGFSFGLGGLGAAALGKLADLTSITTVYRVCPFLLLLGLLTAFLPRRPGAASMKSA